VARQERRQAERVSETIDNIKCRSLLWKSEGDCSHSWVVSLPSQCRRRLGSRVAHRQHLRGGWSKLKMASCRPKEEEPCEEQWALRVLGPSAQQLQLAWPTISSAQQSVDLRDSSLLCDRVTER
jgi:hypothetical protein